MATITKRGNRWTAQVRRRGHPSRSRTFGTRAEAKAWATNEEGRIERGEPIHDRSTLKSITLGDILARYEKVITPGKRGAAAETSRLRKLRRDKACAASLMNLSASDLAEYRDRRLRVVKPATVHRELALISHALDVARREWSIPLVCNVAKDVRKPSPGAARDRRLKPKELDKILAATRKCRNKELAPAIQLAVETGLRRGELLSLDWQHVNLARRLAHIPTTKTGVARTIPLTDAAIAILRPRQKRSGPVFKLSADALRLGWVRVLARAKIRDLRFHDLRHEAISRFFELGLSVPEVALISGHRDPRMLLRYTHMRADTVAQKLKGQAWSAHRTSPI